MPFFSPPLLLVTSGIPYRYHRLEISKHVRTGDVTTIFNFQVKSGSTWYPTSNMTANNAPSPLVALASNEHGSIGPAYYCFDGSMGTRWGGTVVSGGSGVFSPVEWVQFELGSGNAIAPNAIRYAPYNSGGLDYTLIDFAYKASNDGSSFTTIKSWTGEPSGATHATDKEYSVP